MRSLPLASAVGIRAAGTEGPFAPDRRRDPVAAR